MAARPRTALGRRQVAGWPVALVAACGLAVLGTELVLAVAVVEPRLAPLLLPVVAAVAMAIAFRFPLVPAVGLLVLTSSLFHGNFFPVQVGPLKLRDGVLGALLVVALVRPRERTFGGASGAGLAGFLSVLVLASALALAAGRVELQGLISWGRPFVYFLFFFVVVRLFSDRVSLDRLLVAAAGLGAVTGLVSLVVALGSPLGDLLQDSGNVFIREQEGLGILKRVRLPGLALAYGLFWWTVVRTVNAPVGRRLAWAAVLGGMSLNIALSFNRNMWVGLIAGFAVMAVAAGPRVRSRLGTATALAAAVVVLGAFLGAGFAQPAQLGPLAERATSLLDPQSVGEEQSLRDRGRETRLAWQAAQEHPLVGVGAGARYGMFFDEAQSNGRYIRSPQLFLHNQYLYLVLIGGVPALVLFLVFLGSALRAAWVQRPRDAELTALAVGLGSIMLSAIVMLYFSVSDMTATIALISGSICALSRRLRAGEGKSATMASS